MNYIPSIYKFSLIPQLKIQQNLRKIGSAVAGRKISSDMKSTNFRFSSLLLCFFVVFIAAIAGDSNAEEADKCVYTFYVRTGSKLDAGTDSHISIIFGDAEGQFVSIPNIQKWGLMPPSHNYFESGDLDIFSARVPCIPTPLCSITVISDGTGHFAGWYLDYVEVTTTGPHIPCTQTLFKIDQWLATDHAPHKLTASLDGCGVLEGNGVDAKVKMPTNKRGAFVVRGNGFAAASQ